MLNVKIGQIWKICKPHSRHLPVKTLSTFTVLAVDGMYATVMNGLTNRRILLERFEPKRSYYKLMREAR